MLRVSSFLGTAVVVLGLSPAALAQPPLHSWTGFYIGVGAGWDRISTNGEYQLFEDGAQTFSTSFHGSGNGVQGNFFGGYGTNWGPWYASGEIGIGVSSVEADSQFSFTTGDFYDVQVRLRQYWSIVPSVRGGYLFTPELLGFVRFGWAFADTKISYSALEIEGTAQTNFAGSYRRWLNGPRVGVGIEYAILPNVRLRAEWSYTWYNRVSVVGNGGPPPPVADSDVNSVSSRPRQSLLLFNVIYNF